MVEFWWLIHNLLSTVEFIKRTQIYQYTTFDTTYRFSGKFYAELQDKGSAILEFQHKFFIQVLLSTIFHIFYYQNYTELA